MRWNKPLFNHDEETNVMNVSKYKNIELMHISNYSMGDKCMIIHKIDIEKNSLLHRDVAFSLVQS